MRNRLIAGLVTVGMLLPATPASAQSSVLELRPPEQALQAATDFAKQPAVPPAISAMILKAVGFIRGDGESEIEIPENAPAIAQFAWPTVASNCIGGTANATGTAFAVPGPADLPLPGVPAHAATFVFTALGTDVVAENPTTEMRVNWFNITNGRSGVTPLTYTGINPTGPATVAGTADTGAGTIVAVLTGGVSTKIENGVANCEFAPTSGIFEVK